MNLHVNSKAFSGLGTHVIVDLDWLVKGVHFAWSLDHVLLTRDLFS